MVPQTWLDVAAASPWDFCRPGDTSLARWPIDLLGKPAASSGQIFVNVPDSRVIVVLDGPFPWRRFVD
jgi:hypothetical protein